MKDFKLIYKTEKIIDGPYSVSSVDSNILTVVGNLNTNISYIGNMVRVIAGNSEGNTSFITANTTNTITTQLVLTDLSVNDSIVIVENNINNYKTINVMFKNEIISGKDKLIQDVLKALLTQTGSNLYSIEQGTDFLKETFKRSYSINSEEELKTTLVFALSKIKQDIISSQQQLLQENKNLTDSETLVDLTLRKVEFNRFNTDWDIELVISTAVNNIVIGI